MPALRLLPDLEDALRSLPGVQAVSVVTSASGEPTEVHVLAAPGKAAKQVVRDVQSLAMAGFGVDIDHRIVSVVQIAEGVPGELVQRPHAAAPSSPDDGRRAVLASVGVRIAGHEASVTVTLGVGGEEFLGSAEGSASPSQRARLVALAALDAVGPLLGCSCDVESAQLVSAGEHELALVLLSVLAPRSGRQLLAGSAVVRSAAEDALCRAVLDALNRQLTG